MDRRASRRVPASRSRSGGGGSVGGGRRRRHSSAPQQPLPPRHSFDDDDDNDDTEVYRAGNRPAYAQNDSPDEESPEDDDDDEDDEDDDDDDEEYQQRGRRMMDPNLRYSTGSYLPTAYGAGPGGPPDLGLGGGGQQSAPSRERSVDRIRSRGSRRDISRDRHRRDRSRSTSQSRNKGENGNSKNNAAAERRRNRRASLEASLGAMSMDDSASSFDTGSVFSSATGDASLSLLNGMDSSASLHMDGPEPTKGRPRRGRSNSHLQSSGGGSALGTRDSTSTDYTTNRRRHVYKSGKASKTWDGRLDHVLNMRRTGGGPGGGGKSGGRGGGSRSGAGGGS